MFARFTAVVALLTLASPALSQSGAEPSPTTAGVAPPELVFSVRGGLDYEPAFFGSDDYELSPSGGFRLHYLSLGNGWTFGNRDPWFENMGFRPSITTRFISERTSEDYNELDGLDDVDFAFEIGGRLEYAQPNFFTYAAVRRGFGGHEGWVGEAGADYVWRPSDRWRVAVGPRLYWGDDEFVDTYFGVTDEEAGAGSLSSFDADAGLVTAGLRIGAQYRLNRDWALNGALFYDADQDGVVDSPIINEGSEDQWSLRLQVVRAIRMGG